MIVPPSLKLADISYQASPVWVHRLWRHKSDTWQLRSDWQWLESYCFWNTKNELKPVNFQWNRTINEQKKIAVTQNTEHCPQTAALFPPPYFFLFLAGRPGPRRPLPRPSCAADICKNNKLEGFFEGFWPFLICWKQSQLIPGRWWCPGLRWRPPPSGPASLQGATMGQTTGIKKNLN